MTINPNPRFPDQNAERRNSECVGESVAYALSIIDNDIFDPDFSEAAGFKVAAQAPSDLGESPYYAMLGAVAYGGLVKSDDKSDPLQTSQLIESNFDNYTPEQKQTASIYIQRGFKSLRTYDDIIYYLNTQRWPVILGHHFYSTFLQPYPDHTLRTPPLGDTFTNHCGLITGYDSRGLEILMWVGPEYGYAYMNRAIFLQCALEAYAFDPNGWRWLTLVQGALSTGNFKGMLPLIVSADRMK